MRCGVVWCGGVCGVVVCGVVVAVVCVCGVVGVVWSWCDLCDVYVLLFSQTWDVFLS